MRAFLCLTFVVFFLAGCRKSNSILPSETILMDTIYGGDFIWREKQEGKRQTLILDNGKDREKPVFKLNQPNVLRIRIKRFFEYEVFPSNIHGAEIVKVGASESLFLVTPTDTSFSFDINQYYPKGRVIRCIRNWNSETNQYAEQLTPLNGFKSVTNFQWTIK